MTAAFSWREPEVARVGVERKVSVQGKQSRRRARADPRRRHAGHEVQLTVERAVGVPAAAQRGEGGPGDEAAARRALRHLYARAERVLLRERPPLHALTAVTPPLVGAAHGALRVRQTAFDGSGPFYV